MIFLLQSTNDVTPLIRDLGFPIVIALGGAFFVYKNYQYSTRKIDEKDTIINNQIESRRQFNEKLILTQDRIADTQEEIVITQKGFQDTLNRFENILIERQQR